MISSAVWIGADSGLALSVSSRHPSLIETDKVNPVSDTLHTSAYHTPRTSFPTTPHFVILFCDAIFTIELVNTSAGCCCLLLSCIERVAFGTDLYVNIFFGRTCYKSVAAVAGYSCLIIVRMDSFFHIFHLSHSFVNFWLFPIPGQCRSGLSTASYPGLSPQVPVVL